MAHLREPLIHGRVWPALTKAAASARRGPAYVAVAFLGRDAIKRLPLRKGDVLVVNASDEALKTGQTDPREIARFRRRGVEVRSAERLHAKVFVFGDVAYIGSANASASSESHLIEAVVESSSRTLITAARKFVRRLHAVEIGDARLKQMMRLFKAPRFAIHGVARRRAADGIWVLRLSELEWDEEAHRQARKGRQIARRARKQRSSEIQEFMWEGAAAVARFRKRQSVVQVVQQADGATFVEPLGQILSIRRYRTGRNKGCGIVYVETPRGKRRRRLSNFRQRLGSLARQVLKRENQRWVTAPEVLSELREVMG